MPAVIRGKTGGTRALLTGRKSYATDYTINSTKYGSITCQMRVVCGYHKGFKEQHGIRYLIYVVHRVKIALNQLHHYYRQRFGIETSYRLKNHCRIRTTTKNPVLRLLFVALAFILVNLWVYLMRAFHLSPQTWRTACLCRIVAVLPPSEVASMIAAGGFDPPVLFFQNLLMHAWYAKRGSID
jgi:Transposase DDE domain